MADSHEQMIVDANRESRDARRDDLVSVVANFLKGTATFDELKFATNDVRNSSDHALSSLAGKVLWLVELNLFERNFKPDRDDWEELLRILAFLCSDLNLKRENEQPPGKDEPGVAGLLIVLAMAGVVALGAFAGWWVGVAAWIGTGLCALAIFVWEAARGLDGTTVQGNSSDQALARGDDEASLFYPFADRRQCSEHMSLLVDLNLPPFRQLQPSDQEIAATIMRRRSSRRKVTIMVYVLIIASGPMALIFTLAVLQSRITAKN